MQALLAFFFCVYGGEQNRDGGSASLDCRLTACFSLKARCWRPLRTFYSVTAGAIVPAGDASGRSTSTTTAAFHRYRTSGGVSSGSQLLRLYSPLQRVRL